MDTGGIKPQVKRRLARQYLPFFWRAGLPAVGDFDADCFFLVPEFGRENVTEGIGGQLGEIGRLYKEYNYNSYITATEVMKTWPWIDPGPVNRQLASMVLERLKQFPRMRAAVQWSVYIAMLQVEKEHRTSTLNYSRDRIHVYWPPAGASYYRTWEVCAEAIEDMAFRGFFRPVLIAQLYHLPRAFWITLSMGTVPVIRAEDQDKALEEWDVKGIQPPTRSKKNWLRYDTLGRVHHLVHGFVSLKLWISWLFAL